MRIDQHVIFGPQVLTLQRGVREVIVRDPVVIERGAPPTLVLRAQPAMNVPDARRRERVGGDARHRGDRLTPHAKRLGDRRDSRAIGIGQDEAAGRVALAPGLERRLCGEHPHALELEAQGDQRIVAAVVEDNRRAFAGDAAARGDVRGDRRQRLRKHGRVLDRLQLDIVHILHRPAGIVIGTWVTDRIGLHAEVHIEQRAIGLVGADHVIAGRDLDAAGGEALRRGCDLDALLTQHVDHVGGVFGCVLLRGNDPGVDLALALPGLHGVAALGPVILQILRAVGRDAVQRKEQRRFLDVGVVARRPVHRRQRRIGAIPFAAGDGRRQLQVVLDIGAVALHLIEAAEAVVGMRDPEQIVRHPSVVEAIGPHARHAAFGHFHDLRLGEQPPFVRLDRIERGIVRAGAR